MSRAAHIHSSEDARRLARRRLPWMIFDYIDGAAGSGKGAERNRAAFDNICLRPRILRNVSDRSLAATLFGSATQRPFGIAPMGMCNLSAPGADLMLARLAAQYQVPLCVSTVASTSLETLIQEAEGYAWFQLYFSGDGTGTTKLVERAQDAGYETLILTVDVPEVGRRPRELRHGFTMPFRIGPRQFVDFALHPHWSLETLFKGRPEMANFQMQGYSFDRTESRAKADWDTLSELRDRWKGKLVVKGVLDREDAVKLVASGVDAIQVSNHGARQLEAAPAAIEALAEVREAVGADFAFVGRILQFAIAAAGEEGLHRLWEVLSAEMSIAMAQTGMRNL
jgi:(S)-mandelate dehydrogenase